MVDVNTGKCSACGTSIVWAVSVNGKRQPFDAKSEKRCVISYDPATGDDAARVVDTYTPHHATCPSASRFRRVRRTL